MLSEIVAHKCFILLFFSEKIRLCILHEISSLIFSKKYKNQTVVCCSWLSDLHFKVFFVFFFSLLAHLELCCRSAYAVACYPNICPTLAFHIFHISSRTISWIELKLSWRHCDNMEIQNCSSHCVPISKMGAILKFFKQQLPNQPASVAQLDAPSDWRPGGPGFNPPPRSATFFRGDSSGNIFYGHSLPSADSRRAVVSFWRKNVHNTG